MCLFWLGSKQIGTYGKSRRHLILSTYDEQLFPTDTVFDIRDNVVVLLLCLPSAAAFG